MSTAPFADECMCSSSTRSFAGGGGVSGWELRAQGRLGDPGNRPPRFIASTSVHAFELIEIAQTFRAGGTGRLESAPSRCGSGKVRARTISRPQRPRFPARYVSPAVDECVLEGLGPAAVFARKARFGEPHPSLGIAGKPDTAQLVPERVDDGGSDRVRARMIFRPQRPQFPARYVSPAVHEWCSKGRSGCRLRR
jgi:hypothetical protein